MVQGEGWGSCVPLRDGVASVGQSWMGGPIGWVWVFFCDSATRWSVGGPQRLVRGRVAVLFVLFGDGDVFVAVVEPGAGWGGFLCKHCGFLTLESCFHLCVVSVYVMWCVGVFLLRWCVWELSLSDFYRCVFFGQLYLCTTCIYR